MVWKRFFSQNVDLILLSNFTDDKSYIIKFSLSVFLSVRKRFPNHVYYGDEAFTGDSIGLD